MLKVASILVVALLGGCTGPTSHEPEASDAPAVAGGQDAREPITVFEGTFSNPAGLAAAESLPFHVPAGYSKIRIHPIDLAGAAAGAWTVSVTDPAGNRTVMLDELGLRAGLQVTSGTTNNGMTVSGRSGTWTLDLALDGLFSIEFVIDAS